MYRLRKHGNKEFSQLGDFTSTAGLKSIIVLMSSPHRKISFPEPPAITSSPAPLIIKSIPGHLVLLQQYLKNIARTVLRPMKTVETLTITAYLRII